jgi:Right handed beta helix region
MKKNVTLLLLWILLSVTAKATDYYVNALSGNDTNKGTSQEKPFESLEKVSSLALKPGDKVLLANGMVFSGSLELEDIEGTAMQPITIGSYSNNKDAKGSLPVIDAGGFRNGILLLNCSNIVISDMVITANGGGVPNGIVKKDDMRCGVLVTTSKSGVYGGVKLNSLTIKDIFFEEEGFARGKDEVHSANGTQNYGWGIRVINSTADAIIKGIMIESCEIRNVAHTGIKFTGREKSISEVRIFNSKVFETGGPGIQMSGVKDGLVRNNNINESGSGNDSRKWGRGSGLWTWSCENIIIEHNSFRNGKGPADSAGCHIDFNCSNVIVQYCLSENNAGGFCEILGNNYNCAYRYNVSINDGYRVTNKDGAFQDGKIFWLSGYIGKGQSRKGPFNSYFYNNTIYVKSDIVAKMAVDRASEGILIANNIFFIEGESKYVLGDQYVPEKAGKSLVKNIVFRNNLFLKAESWPTDMILQDERPIFGNPQFLNPGGKEIKDYTPQNKSLVKDKGIKIPKIPGDELGLFIGLESEHDIMGRDIVGLPDMGAIEIN